MTIAQVELKSENKPFESKHKLAFEVAPWMPSVQVPDSENFMCFRVGTCEGLWTCTKDTYDILAITNSIPGNGHFEDVLQWFEQSCRRDGKSLRILEVWNYDFYAHLIKKRGFKKQPIFIVGSIYARNVVKEFK